MMLLLEYLALSGIGIALFYLIDRLFLRKSTLFRAQRFYYIVAVVTSLLIPLAVQMIPPLQTHVEAIDIPTITLKIEFDDFTVVAPTAEAQTEPSLSSLWWVKALTTLWIVGMITTVLWLALGLGKIVSLIKAAQKQRLDQGVLLYITDQEVAPFTIGRRIVVPRSLTNGQIIHSILTHELEHVYQKHYIDLALSVLLQLLQWWNPFAWSMLQQQRNTLEYLADEGVLKQGTERKAYQYHLLECTIGRSVKLPTLSFSMQNLKKRIKVMNRKKSTNKWVAGIYAAMSLPIIALLLIGTQMVTIDKVFAAAPEEISINQTPPTETPDKDGVFDFLKDMPEFNGGQKALIDFLLKNVKYPPEAIEKNIQGRVMVRFIIEKDGKVSNVEVINGVDELLDKEAVRVVSSMPNWKPGRYEGDPVRVRYTLPIQWRLPDGKEDNQIGEDGVYEYVDNLPEFPGGHKALMVFLSENINYPKEAVENNIQGRVMVRFVVEKDGSITNVQIGRGVEASLDQESIRVISMMPKWKPGSLKDGTLVATRFTLPVQYRLSNGTTKNSEVSTSDNQIGENGVYDYLKDMPEFHGGQKALMDFLNENINYPKEAAKNKIQGRVMTRFIVKADGSIADIEVIKSVDPLLDAEAIRVLKLMPNWKPGRLEDGTAVNARFTVPIQFKLLAKDAPKQEENNTNMP